MQGGIRFPPCIEALLCSETPSLALVMGSHPVFIEVHLSSKGSAAAPICATPAMASARAVGLSTFGAFRNGHSTPFWTGLDGGWVLRPSLPCPEILGIGATYGMRTGCVPCLCPAYALHATACRGMQAMGISRYLYPLPYVHNAHEDSSHSCARSAHECAMSRSVRRMQTMHKQLHA
jgi:hypothetical protein